MRVRKRRTQDVVAGELGISRSTLNSYENGSIKNPTMEIVVRFSEYFNMAIDTLIKIDLSTMGEFQLQEMERKN